MSTAMSFGLTASFANLFEKGYFLYEESKSSEFLPNNKLILIDSVKSMLWIVFGGIIRSNILIIGFIISLSLNFIILLYKHKLNTQELQSIPTSTTMI
tara:strand:- start:2084 stop:2377 length:294 start_codon:yes stop_codon:yes gene_type:complete